MPLAPKGGPSDSNYATEGNSTSPSGARGGGTSRMSPDFHASYPLHLKGDLAIPTMPPKEIALPLQASLTEAFRVGEGQG
jgi:hypothetical protein